MNCPSCDAIHAELSGVRAQLDATRTALRNEGAWLHATPVLPDRAGVYWGREKGACWRLIHVIRTQMRGLQYWDDGQELDDNELAYFAEWSGKIPRPE